MLTNDHESADLARSLRPGCHVIGFVPINPRMARRNLVPLVGSMRVVDDENGLAFSGDLYQTGPTAPLTSDDFFDSDDSDGSDGSDAPEDLIVEFPDARRGVPIFAFNAYDSYLRGLSVRSGPNAHEIELVFERYILSTERRRRWLTTGSFVAQLERTEPTTTSPSAEDDWVGLVRDASGTVIGMLTLTWAAAPLRRARLMVAAEDGAETPSDNGLGVDWVSVLAAAGWQLQMDSLGTISPPPSGLWSEADLHHAMADIGVLDHDQEWGYRMLCVKDFDPAEIQNVIGVMFDRRSDDLNQIPREGFAVSANHVLSTDADFGAIAGQRVGGVAGVYFRAAVHELGHALGLHHEPNTFHFMNTTADVADLGTEEVPFPDNIAYAFSTESVLRLQHSPDPEVRPGGPFRLERGSNDYFDQPPLPRSTRNV